MCLENKKILKFLIKNIIYIIGFSLLFAFQGNQEFIIYILVLISLMFLIIFSNKKMNYPHIIFIGFSIWGLIHMMGGGLYWDGIRFYDLILIPLSDKYPILRYDQVAHFFANYISTILLFILIKPQLKSPIKNWISLSVVIIMAGSGIGVMNEIIEFVAVIFTNNNGVGGYLNTALDLIFNLLGGISAMCYLGYKKGNI